MRLICPNCDAQYEVPDEVIPTSGRDVQCSNCGQTWFQHHADHMPEEEDEDLDYAAPAQDAVLPALPVTLSGTAADNVGVARVEITVQDAVTKAWLQNDGSWGPWATRQRDAVLADPGGVSTAWSFIVSTPGSGSYGSSATAIDAAGNASSTTWRRFGVG